MRLESVSILCKTVVVTQVTSYPYHLNFTHKLFVVQICQKLVTFMTFVCVSSIFEAPRFALIGISKIDIMTV